MSHSSSSAEQTFTFVSRLRHINILSAMLLFIRTADSLKSMDVTRAGKWRKYLEIKQNFYLAYVSHSMYKTAAVIYIYIYYFGYTNKRCNTRKITFINFLPLKFQDMTQEDQNNFHIFTTLFVDLFMYRNS